MKEKLDELLESIGSIPMIISIGREDIPEVVPQFIGKRCVLNVSANSRRDALEQIEQIHKILD